MFFNLFGNKKEKGCRIIDATYITEEAKQMAIINYTKDNPTAYCLTWFAETNKIYKALFLKNNLAENRVVEAKFYNALKFPGKEFFFAEHYPLPVKEDDILQRLPQKSILVYNAVSDELFKKFGGERIIAVMKNMNVKEDEVITHDMISKSIRRAQDKIAESITTEYSAASQQEWFKRNLLESI